MGRRLKILMLISMFLCFQIVFSNSVFASTESIKSKATFEGVYNCANNLAAYNTSWLASSGIENGFLLKGGGQEPVKLPYGLTEDKDNKMDCKDVMRGKTLEKGKSLLPSNITGNANPNKVEISNYFVKLGYESTAQGDVDTTKESETLILSNLSCINDKEIRVSGSITSSDTSVVNDRIVFPTIAQTKSGNRIVGNTTIDTRGINVPAPNGSLEKYTYSACNSKFSIQDVSTGTASVSYRLLFASGVDVTVNSEGAHYGGGLSNESDIILDNNNSTLHVTIEKKSADDSSGVFDDYKLEWPKNKKPIELVKGINENNGIGYSVSGLSKYDDLKFDRQETYDLYTYYISQVFKVSVVCEGEDSYEYYKDEKKINWQKGGVDCRIVETRNEESPKNVFGLDSNNHFTATVDLDAVLAGLEKLGDLSDLDTKNAGTLQEELEDGGEEGSGDKADITCANSGGAISLGWIVCPVMEWLGDAADKAYSDYVEPSLRVDPKLFSGNDDGDDGIRQGWETFRNIANILFIILLLAVIFSQLTGVGIDNYGIKKILPKLIVAAILINLSYLICIICVDLSNILGNGLRAMFDGLGAGLNPSLNIEDANAPGGGNLTIAPTVLTGAGILATLVVMVGTIWTNPAVLLSMLVAALGVAIAIFFLFVLLAMREAAIVVLVAISPLAVVCYMLPNTKNLFNKWLKFFEGLLLVYPICGLLVGGGNYVSNLLLSSGFGENGFLQAFTAMIVGIVPIFFIPTVLKGSFAAMGTIGGKLAGLGNAAKRGATSKVRGSEAYKNAQKMGLDRKMRYKAGYSERKGGLTATGRLKSRIAQSGFGRITGMNKRQAAYVETARKNADIGKESTAILMAESTAANIARSGLSPKDYFQQQIDSTKGDIRKLDSVISAAEKRGIKKKDIAAMIRSAQNDNRLSFKNDQSRSNWMNSMLQNHGDIMSTDFELQEWARAGGTRRLGAYGDYASSYLNDSDIDISDLSKVSGNSMAGLIKAGKISSPVAQQWLAANPNASPDKKVMMGAVASGAINSGNLGGITAERFKEEAEALANGQAALADGTSIMNTSIVQGIGTNRPENAADYQKLVDSWTATAQVRTYISQDPSTIKPTQRQSEDNPVFTHEVGDRNQRRVGGGSGINIPHNNP